MFLILFKIRKFYCFSIIHLLFYIIYIEITLNIFWHRKWLFLILWFLSSWNRKISNITLLLILRHWWIISWLTNRSRRLWRRSINWLNNRWRRWSISWLTHLNWCLRLLLYWRRHWICLYNWFRSSRLSSCFICRSFRRRWWWLIININCILILLGEEVVEVEVELLYSQ